MQWGIEMVIDTPTQAAQRGVNVTLAGHGVVTMSHAWRRRRAAAGWQGYRPVLDVDCRHVNRQH